MGVDVSASQHCGRVFSRSRQFLSGVRVCVVYTSLCGSVLSASLTFVVCPCRSSWWPISSWRLLVSTCFHTNSRKFALCVCRVSFSRLSSLSVPLTLIHTAPTPLSSIIARLSIRLAMRWSLCFRFVCAIACQSIICVWNSSAHQKIGIT